ARLVGSNDVPNALPPVNAIPPSSQQVRQVIDVNVRPDQAPNGTSTSSQTIGVNVDSTLSSGNPEVRTVGHANSDGSMTAHTFVEAYG
ncbi:hypothetical protein ACI4BE_28870, partial [Klebsiella pneumoniae]|uniref:hypothetical protein n=1 Tax=Klebsiella pneumoniae TaxID=573 RepID=UPI0038530BC7